MKRTAVLIIAVCIIIAASCCAAPSDTEYLTPDNITNAFSIDGQIYYIEQSGSLYAYGNEEPVFTFPTHIIAWSEHYNAFVYLDGKTLCTYSLQNGEVTECAKLNINIKDSFTDYVCCIYGSTAYICGADRFAFDLETQERITVDSNIKNMIAADENVIIYTATNSSEIYMLDILSGEVTLLTSKASDSPIVSACIYNDSLLYICEDGVLNGVNLNGEPLESLPEISEHIVALAACDNRLFCAVSETKNGVKYISSLYEVHTDGNLTELDSFQNLSWSVPGSCRLHLFGGNYAIYVTTSDMFITGTI